MNWQGGVILIALIAPSWCQQPPEYPVRYELIFPSLLLGRSSWSLVRLTNTSNVSKSARVEAYCGKGQALPLQRNWRVMPGASQNVRIEFDSQYPQLCWVRIEARSRSEPVLQASARLEQVDGNKLMDFPLYVSLIERTKYWLSPGDAVSNQRLYFLNLSNKATTLEVCSVNAQPTCSADHSKPTRATVEPRQSIVLTIGKLQKRELSISSAPFVPSVIGLLRPEAPTTREFSSQSSIRFDEPVQ